MSSSVLVVRKATAEDFERILPLAHRFFEASKYGREMAFDDVSFKQTFDHLISGEDGVFFVAAEDGEIVGLAGALAYPFYFNSAHKTGQELFWWVDPDARGSSVGVSMFDALECWAREQGCKTFSMICLDSLRPEAVSKIYQRRGYRASEHTFIKEL